MSDHSGEGAGDQRMGVGVGARASGRGGREWWTKRAELLFLLPEVELGMTKSQLFPNSSLK